MTSATELSDEISALRLLLRQKESGRGSDLSTALRKAKRRLPRRVYRQGQKLAQAEHVLDHPKLRLTLDQAMLRTAARELREHLEGIDLADRRKGFWLNVAGGMAFSLLAVAVLVVAVLIWRGLI